MDRLFDMQDIPPKNKSNEWYTPSRYIEAARKVMGEIDLDPASCEIANRTVKATRYYAQAENGLMQPWYGRVWLNPPYGRVRPELTGSTQSYQKAFALKLIGEYLSGRVEQAILLSLGNPNCTWFQPFFDYLICFQRGTIDFIKSNGEEGHFGFPLSFVYLGSNETAFIEYFSEFGRIAKAIDEPKTRLVNLDLWQNGTFF